MKKKQRPDAQDATDVKRADVDPARVDPLSQKQSREQVSAQSEEQINAISAHARDASEQSRRERNNLIDYLSEVEQNVTGKYRQEREEPQRVEFWKIETFD